MQSNIEFQLYTMKEKYESVFPLNALILLLTVIMVATYAFKRWRPKKPQTNIENPDEYPQKTGTKHRVLLVQPKLQVKEGWVI